MNRSSNLEFVKSKNKMASRLESLVTGMKKNSESYGMKTTIKTRIIYAKQIGFISVGRSNSQSVAWLATTPIELERVGDQRLSSTQGSPQLC